MGTCVYIMRRYGSITENGPCFKVSYGMWKTERDRESTPHMTMLAFSLFCMGIIKHSI
jgi:hypothetical protein